MSINIEGIFSNMRSSHNFFVSTFDFSLSTSPSKEILPFPSVNKIKVGKRPLDFTFLVSSKMENNAEAKGVVPPPGNEANFFFVWTKDFVGGNKISAFFPLKAIKDTRSLFE